MNEEFPLGTKLQALSGLLFRDLLFRCNFPTGLEHIAMSENSICCEQLPHTVLHITHPLHPPWSPPPPSLPSIHTSETHEAPLALRLLDPLRGP